MYPLVRLLNTLRRTLNASKIAITDRSEMQFICRPWDIDMFQEMNNGRILTLYDLGRFDLAIRSGLVKALRQNHWGLVVAGSSVRYRKRIRMFDRVTIRSQVVGAEDRWFYIVQSMWVKGEACSSVLLRTGITEKGKTILVDRVAKATGNEHIEPDELPLWVREWIQAESHRPWPPL
jgi:acyl-CoA thioesterase FadM